MDDTDKIGQQIADYRVKVERLGKNRSQLQSYQHLSKTKGDKFDMNESNNLNIDLFSIKNLIDLNHSKKALNQDYETNIHSVFQRKASPPGKDGIESITALGNANASPVSNYYCKGYHPA